MLCIYGAENDVFVRVSSAGWFKLWFEGHAWWASWWPEINYNTLIIFDNFLELHKTCDFENFTMNWLAWGCTLHLLSHSWHSRHSTAATLHLLHHLLHHLRILCHLLEHLGIHTTLLHHLLDLWIVHHLLHHLWVTCQLLEHLWIHSRWHTTSCAHASTCSSSHSSHRWHTSHTWHSSTASTHSLHTRHLFTNLPCLELSLRSILIKERVRV